MESANLTNLSRPIFVVGSQGQLGTTLANSLRNLAPSFAEKNFHAIAFNDSPDFPQMIADQISSYDVFDMIIATGLTNPTLDPKSLEKANLLQVQEIISHCHGPQRRFITLGSIFEKFPEVCQQNAYLNSKQKLSQWVASQNTFNIRHLRLHTIYGGERKHLKEYMFLGQIAKALTSGQEFKMSSGEQLREYHHVHDVSQGILAGLSKPWNKSQICEVNSGKPLKLKDIATELFKTYGRLESLHIGAIDSAKGENMTQVFLPDFSYAHFHFRDAISGIKEWFNQIL